MSFDDELRRRMQQAADTTGQNADPSGVVEIVAARAGEAAATAATVKLVGGLGVAGLVIGGILGLSVLQPSSDGAAAGSAPSVDVVGHTATDCPNGTPVRTLRAGDRVYVVGRAADSAWVAVRDPADVATPVWLPESAVDADEAIDAPVLECDPDAAASASLGTAPSTTSPPITAPTSDPSASEPTTTPPPATAPPVGVPTPNAPPPPAPTPNAPPPPPPAVTTTTATTTTTTTTTTLPPDNTDPVIGQPAASVSPIYTTPCDGAATASTISVIASDNVGVVSVTGTYNGGSFGLNRSGGQWIGTFGAFQNPPPGPPQKQITLTARDLAGNTSATSLSVTVFSCPF